MPIRINLLAEAQALEEMRRRDPVKRAILAGIVMVALVLAYSSSLQLKAMMARSELSRIEAELGTHTNEYSVVLENQKALTDLNHRILSLEQLATNRLLYGNLLNALQQTVIPDVQVTRLRAEQNYAYTEAVKSKTNANRVIPGKPATVTERILVTLEAHDNGAISGDQMNVFKQNISKNPYFQEMLGSSNEVRLASLSPPAELNGRKYVAFTLECRYPEKTR